MISDFVWSGIGLYLDVSGTTGIPMWAWLVPLILGLVVAPFLSFHKVRVKRDELKNKLADLENQRPTVEVTPYCEGKFARLRVTNTGQHRASFKVQIVSWKGIPLTEPPMSFPYYARWQNRGSISEIDLHPKESWDLEIIQYEGKTLDDEGKDNRRLRKVKITCPNNLESKITIRSVLKCSIRILANPELRDRAERTYRMTIGSKGWAQFQEL